MGARIEILADTLIDQIAAGEVIERPANVVRELLDNALDAGATNITVRIEDGGRALIQVTDDGHGMPAGDAAICVRRYATSKLRRFEDLVELDTLGFRGEALPSIAAVSDFELLTRPRGETQGTRVRSTDDVTPHGCAPGTEVTVRSLFANVPARLKFLKARQTESAAIYETCLRTALIHPSIRLVVHNERRTVREYLPATSMLERAERVFECALTTVDTRRGDVGVLAALSQAGHARRGSRQLFLYANGRPISDRRLARAVALAFGEQLTPGHYPQGVLALTLPAEQIDVNAHPQKAEVRFARPSRVFDAVSKALAPRVRDPGAAGSYWRQRLGPLGPQNNQSEPTPQVRAKENLGHYGQADPRARGGGVDGVYRIVGRDSRGRYLAVEGDGELLVVDLRAASARVLEDQYVRDIESGTVGRQQALFPDRVELGALELDALKARDATLAALGFELSVLGPSTVAIRATPSLLSEARPADLLRAALTANKGPNDPSSAGRQLVDVAVEAGALVEDASIVSMLSEAPQSGFVAARLPLNDA